MKAKITFHNMPHSDALELHAKEKLTKVKALFLSAKNFSVELFLNAESAHAPHHHVEIKINNGLVHIAASAQSGDMYLAIDTAIEKACAQIRKEKTKAVDKKQRVKNEKVLFTQ